MEERVPQSLLDPGTQSRVVRQVSLARAALFWEQLWPALWLPATILGAFLALSLLDVLPRLPSWAHVAALAIFGVAFVTAVWRALVALTLPDEADARRRLEVASDLTHRPLSGIDDRLALGATDPVSRALWEAHRRRLALAKHADAARHAHALDRHRDDDRHHQQRGQHLHEREARACAGIRRRTERQPRSLPSAS